jgi:phosphate transport system ATP-binding protein
MTGPGIRIENVEAWYGRERALTDFSAILPAGQVTAVLGTTGSGKTTLGRILNRLAEVSEGFRWSGEVYLGPDRLRTGPVDQVRRRVGMVFDRPTAFPGTIRDNVGFGLRPLRLQPAERDERVERALRRAGLWEEVREGLDAPATKLQAGRRQLLCLARVLALEPDVLVLDEPGARLHPAETARIEAVVSGLVPDLSVVFITPDVGQAGRVAEHVIFLEGGRLVEHGQAGDVFTNPQKPETQAYLSRRFGAPAS